MKLNNFYELVYEENEECVKEWSTFEVNFEKLNSSSKEFILIEIDVFNNLIKTCV